MDQSALPSSVTYKIIRTWSSIFYYLIKIYLINTICGEDYVGETKRNISVCYDEHNKPSKKSKPAAHLEQNIDHYFTWRILCNAPSNAKTRKSIEAFFIAIMRPSLNEQTDSDALILFRNGVT